MSSENNVFTAIPYDGFEALLGTSFSNAATSSSSSFYDRFSLSLSDERKEQLVTGLKITACVCSTVGFGMAVGFSIAALVNHCRHNGGRKHNHHHHTFHHSELGVVAAHDKNQVFWGVDHVQQHVLHSRGVDERPTRRHSSLNSSSNKNSKDNRPRLRKHLIHKVQSEQQQQPQAPLDDDWGAFFAMEDYNDEYDEQEEELLDNFFPLEDDEEYY